MGISRSVAGQLLLALLLGGSVYVNVLQGKRIAALEDSARDSIVSRNSSRLRTPLVGALVRPLRVKDLSGAPALIDYAQHQKPVLIYVFSPSCPWCRKNSRLFNSLISQVSDRYDVIGLSLSDDRLGQYVSESNLRFPVYGGVSEDAALTYGLASTPETIVVSPAGKIMGAWRGAYLNSTRPEIERFFSVALSE